jgi:Mg2+/Co2+ transporter CorB
MQFGPLLTAMAVLLGCSAFFSGSEAALFYLGREDRRAIRKGSAAQRLAADLLKTPRRLLTAILFWNLLINITYFAIASIIGLRLKVAGQNTELGLISAGSLLVLILFGEVLPKNLAVLHPRFLSQLVSVPLTVSVRALDPLMPVLHWMHRISRRTLFPHFEVEAYLELGDLERAITLSTTDKTLAHQERNVLQNIVALSDMRVDELMRPRRHYQSFRPPVGLADLGGRLPPSGSLLVTEPDSDEVAGAIPILELSDVPTDHLEHVAQKVVYVPWCTSVAAALDDLSRQECHVAAVVNEHGETIGILTDEDILETVFHRPSSRSERVFHTPSMASLPDGVWEVTGMTTIRRLSKRLKMRLPASKAVTVGGVLQEQLQRLPAAGDVVEWGGLRMAVVAAPERGLLKARVQRVEPDQTEASQ